MPPSASSCSACPSFPGRRWWWRETIPTSFVRSRVVAPGSRTCSAGWRSDIQRSGSRWSAAGVSRRLGLSLFGGLRRPAPVGVADRAQGPLLVAIPADSPCCSLIRRPGPERMRNRRRGNHRRSSYCNRGLSQSTNSASERSPAARWNIVSTASSTSGWVRARQLRSTNSTIANQATRLLPSGRG